MAKYGIGARVRDDDGDLGEVMDKRKGERLVRYDDLGVGLTWRPKSGLEPANDNATTRPEVCDIAYKVGGRVRLILSGDYNGNGAYGATGEEGVVVGIDDSDKTACIKFDKSGQWWAEQSNIEPAQWAPIAPAPLTIAAGRFYSTRDGRKVGPVVANASVDKEEGRSGESYPFAIGRDSFTAEGRNGYDTSIDMQADLVAEWVEPAAPVEVAVAEAPETSLPKFKVGDTVRVIASPYLSTAALAGGTGVITDVAGTNRGDWIVDVDNGFGLGFHESELIVQPSPATFKVGDRVLSSGNPFTKYRIEAIDGESVSVRVVESNGFDGCHFEDQKLDLFSLDPDFTAAPAPTIPIGSTVTFTATGRLSAINENGHHQVTFPGLPAARNSFALPAQYVALAN